MDAKVGLACALGGALLLGMVAWVLIPGDSAEVEVAESSPVEFAQDTPPAFIDTPSVTTDPFAGVPTATLPVAPPAAGQAPTIPGQTPIVVSQSPTIPGQTPSAAGQIPATPAQIPPTTPTAASGTIPTIPGQPAQIPATQPTTTSVDVWASVLDRQPATSTTTTTSTGYISPFSQPSAVAANPVPRTYRVVSGDSLYSISERIYGNSRFVDEIQAANPNVNPRRLRVGQEIILPDISATGSTTPAIAAPAPTTLDSTSVAAAARTYKAQPGDTLHRIARNHYGNTDMWEQIFAANRAVIGSDPGRLIVGTVLQLP